MTPYSQKGNILLGAPYGVRSTGNGFKTTLCCFFKACALERDVTTVTRGPVKKELTVSPLVMAAHRESDLDFCCLDIVFCCPSCAA